MSQMQLQVLVNPVINTSDFQAQGAAAGANYANSFNKAFSKTQPLGKITGDVSEFEKSMEAANARVLAFGASAGSIYVIKAAFDKLISSTIGVEKNLTDINVVLGLGATSLKAFSNEMFRAASSAGQTFDTASKVALEFARHGVSAAETAKRMTSAMQLMRISGLSAEEAVSSITASLNSFNREGLTSEDVVNRLTAVDTKFAVSAGDLAKAIQRVGSTAADAGVGFNQLLGFVTAAQTATSRGGAVIGNAFKSIFTRLGRPEVLADLEAVGVTTKDATGQILPMVSILKNLATQYSSLNYAQKSFVTEMVGGVYQVNILKASLTDLGNGFSIFDKATIAAGNSSGLIQKRMDQLNETISSKLITSSNNLTKIFSDIGNIAIGDKMKKGLDSFNDAISNTGTFSLGKLFENVSDVDSAGLKVGKTLTAGITKGLGDIVSGPGLQVGIVLLTKIFSDIGKFAVQSSRGFLGLNDAAQREAVILSSVQNYLNGNEKLMEGIKNGQVSINDAHTLYLNQLAREAQLKAQNLSISQQIASLAGSSIKTSPAGKVGTIIARGFIPNFNSDFDREESLARSLGAKNPKAHYGKGTIAGKSFIMNNEETEIPNFGSNGDSAVIPHYSQGFIPNFARKTIKSLLGNDSSGNLKDLYDLDKNDPKNQYKKVDTYEFTKPVFRKSLPHTSSEYDYEAHKLILHAVGEDLDIRKFLYQGKVIGDYLPGKFNQNTLKYGNRRSNINNVKGALGEIDTELALYKEGFLAKKLGIQFGVDFLINRNNRIGLVESKTTKTKINDEVLAAKALTFIGRTQGKKFKNNQVDDNVGIDGVEIFQSKETFAKGFVPNFALDKIFSLTPQKFKKGISVAERGAEYEQELLSRLPGLGFTGIKHLSGSLGNSEADFYARYEGSPWFLDAKATSGDQSKLSRLSEKERTMRALWARMQKNPASLAQLGPNLINEADLMKFGVVLSNIPSSAAIRNYGKAGSEYQNLSKVASGFIPNFEDTRSKEEKLRALLAPNSGAFPGERAAAEQALNRLTSLSPSDMNYLKSNKDTIMSGMGRGLGQDFNVDALILGDLKYATKTGLPMDVAEVLSKIVKKPGGRDTLRKLLRGHLFAGGFIPNFSALDDAMEREMSAGYSASQVKVGRDSSLISSNNPAGLGVFNSTEGTLSKGISLAKSAGIDPKTKGMARGFIPNFADLSEGLLLLGALQGGGQLNTLKGKMAALAFGYDKQIAKTQSLYESFDKLKAQLDTLPSKRNSTPDQKAQRISLENDIAEIKNEFKNNNKFGITNKREKEAHTNAYREYSEKINDTKTSLTSAAYKTMIGVPLAGGVASEALKNSGFENISRSVSSISEGFTQAAQAVSALPDRRGIAIGTALFINKAEQAVNQFISKVATLEKEFDVISTKLEKTSSSLTSLSQNYDALNELYKSGNGTLSQYFSLTRNISKGVGQLSSLPGGAALAQQYTSAGTSQKRAEVQAEITEKLSNEKDRSQFKFQYAKLQEANGYAGFNPTAAFGDKGGFSASSESQAITNTDLLKGFAGLLQNEAISDIQKSPDKEAAKGIASRVSEGMTTFTDVEKIITAARNSTSYKDLAKKDKKGAEAGIEELSNNLKSVAISDVDLSAYKASFAQFKSLQIQEVNLRKQYNQELQNSLSKGSILSSFQNNKYLQGLKQEGRKLGTKEFFEEKGLDLKSLIASNVQVIAERGASKNESILNSTSIQQKELFARGAENINKEFLNPAIQEVYNQSSAKTGENFQAGANSVSPTVQAASKYIEKRQALFSGANAEKLVTVAQSPSSFASAFLGGTREQVSKNSGLNSDIVNQLFTTIETKAQSQGFTEKIADLLEQNANILQTGQEEFIKNQLETTKAIKEAQFKELSQALGGLNLLDKGGTREASRKVKRAQYLEEHGITAESRGRGARDLLTLIPEGRRNANDPFIKKLLTEVQSGIKSADQRVLGGSSIAKYFGNEDDLSYAQTRGNIKTTEVGQVPASLQISQIDTTPLTAAIKDSSGAIDFFEKQLYSLGSNLGSLTEQINANGKSQEKKQEELNKFKTKSGSTDNGNITPNSWPDRIAAGLKTILEVGGGFVASKIAGGVLEQGISSGTQATGEILAGSAEATDLTAAALTTLAEVGIGVAALGTTLAVIVGTVEGVAIGAGINHLGVGRYEDQAADTAQNTNRMKQYAHEKFGSRYDDLQQVNYQIKSKERAINSINQGEIDSNFSEEKKNQVITQLRAQIQELNRKREEIYTGASTENAGQSKTGKSTEEQLASSFNKFSSSLDSFVVAVNALKDVKLQDGALTIAFDASSLKQQIQTMISTSIAGKVNPPTIA